VHQHQVGTLPLDDSNGLCSRIGGADDGMAARSQKRHQVETNEHVVLHDDDTVVGRGAAVSRCLARRLSPQIFRAADLPGTNAKPPATGCGLLPLVQAREVDNLETCLAMSTVLAPAATPLGGRRVRKSAIETRRLPQSASRGCVVRAGGLEPPQALLPYGFSYQLRLSPPSSPGSAQGGGFVVWTIPSPCPGPESIRRRVGAARLVSTPSHRDGLGEAASL